MGTIHNMSLVRRAIRPPGSKCLPTTREGVFDRASGTMKAVFCACALLFTACGPSADEIQRITDEAKKEAEAETLQRVAEQEKQQAARAEKKRTEEAAHSALADSLEWTETLLNDATTRLHKLRIELPVYEVELQRAQSFKFGRSRSERDAAIRSASFKLEGLRSYIPETEERIAELKAIQQKLREELGK